MPNKPTTLRELEKEVRDIVRTKYAIFHAFKHPEINGEKEMESLIDLITTRFLSHSTELLSKIEGIVKGSRTVNEQLGVGLREETARTQVLVDFKVFINQEK